MDGPRASSALLDPARTQHLRGLKTRWKRGESGNPEGRRAELRKREAQAREELGAPDTTIQDTVRLTVVLRSKVDPEELADLLLGLCRQGNLRAIAYVYDRIEGSPVQRHEAKLQTEVDNTARILAERYGLSIEDVRARAKAIASGS